MSVHRVTDCLTEIQQRTRLDLIRNFVNTVLKAPDRKLEKIHFSIKIKGTEVVACTAELQHRNKETMTSPSSLSLTRRRGAKRAEDCTRSTGGGGVGLGDQSTARSEGGRGSNASQFDECCCGSAILEQFIAMEAEQAKQPFAIRVFDVQQQPAPSDDYAPRALDAHEEGAGEEWEEEQRNVWGAGVRRSQPRVSGGFFKMLLYIQVMMKVRATEERKPSRHGANAARSCVVLKVPSNMQLWLHSTCNCSCHNWAAADRFTKLCHEFVPSTSRTWHLSRLTVSANPEETDRTWCHHRYPPQDDMGLDDLSTGNVRIRVCSFTSRMADSATPSVACSPTGLSRKTNSTNGLPTQSRSLESYD